MLKEAILQKSFTSHLPDENEFKELVKRSVTYIDDAAGLPVAAVAYLDQAYNVQGVTYVCEEISAGVYDWTTYDTSGQSLDYNNASHKPTINGVTLSGTMTATTLGLAEDTSGRTATTNPALANILLDDDSMITYENLAEALNTLFDIANLPKYEKQNNPLLTTSGGEVKWEITHTCKTSEPSVELYNSGGIKITKTDIATLVIQHGSKKTLSIVWASASNVAANEYYVVLIG